LAATNTPNLKAIKKLTRIKYFWVLTLLLLLLIAYGYYGMVVNAFTQTDIASRQAWWFLIPAIPVATYYAYRCPFSYDRSQAFWKNLLGTIVCTLFFSLVLVKSFQGYLCIYNSSFGTKSDFNLKAFINYVKKPKYSGRLLSLYTLEVTLDSNQKKMTLETKINTYEAGQRLELSMKKGSLGYLYLPK
jgi:hypothetical protein